MNSTPIRFFDDLGKLMLRVSLAVLILFHGVSKLIGGPTFVTATIAKLGLPEQLGYFVYVGEVLAPLLLLMGAWTRLAALLVACNMVVAVLLVHTSQVLTLAPTGGWALELQGMYLAAAISIALLGAGRYSVSGVDGKWN